MIEVSTDRAISALSRPSLLLWDWDNTLVDAWSGITIAINAAFTAFGLTHWTVEDTRRRARISMRESFPLLFGPDWQKAVGIFRATLSDNHLDHVRVMPDAVTMLTAGAPWTQGVVSNKSTRYLRAEIDHLGWSPYFETVVGAGEAAADKPDPAPLLLALARLQAISSSSVWYIGDTASDMQAASAAGVTAVLLGDAAHDGGVEQAAPDLYFPTARHLAASLRFLA